MRGAIALALMLSASILVLGPASAQQGSTTGAAPPLVPQSTTSPPATLSAPVLAPAALPALVPPAAGTQPTTTPAPARAQLAPPPAVPAAAPARAPLPSLTPQRAPLAAPPPAPEPSRASAPTVKCDNPSALGVSRTVEIDTTGGPGFGFEHFRQHDFLRDKEVVLTFDDGPWVTTPTVLKALAAECVRATFFVIGKHATFYPEILRQVAKDGHSIGSHTWSHQDLSKKTVDEAKAEIERR
jgi:hypothetical protein